MWTTAYCDASWRTLTAVLFAVFILASCSKHTELDPAVNQLTLKTLSGTDVALNDSQGPTLINFWSTSCVICIKEMPHLAQLYDEHAATGFQLIAVAMPYDPPNEVLELATQLKLPFPVAIDIQGEAVAAFGSVQGTPTSFLLDAEGKLVKRYVGKMDLSKLTKQLKKLLETS